MSPELRRILATADRLEHEDAQMRIVVVAILYQDRLTTWRADFRAWRARR